MLGARQIPNHVPELESFFWTSADSMVVLDASLRIVFQNPQFDAWFGISAPNRSILDVFSNLEREKANFAFLACSASTTVHSFEATNEDVNQLRRRCEWTCRHAPETGHFLVTVRDRTEKHRLRDELAQAQKLEAVGQLASGIAHEINTPIQFIGDNLAFIGDSLSDLFGFLNALVDHEPSRVLLEQHPHLDLAFLASDLPASVEQALDGIQRIAELVRSMKEFAHQDRGEVVPTDVNRAIDRTLAICKSEWKHVAVVETHFGELPFVPCQASSLRQVLLNLICNAAQANAERNHSTARAMGTITVRSRVEGQSAVIEISDSGNGMSEATKKRIFEPFFTTKPVGRGTGQGLTLSRAIITDQHHGSLTFDSELGVGTTFRITLPLTIAGDRP